MQFLIITRYVGLSIILGRFYDIAMDAFIPTSAVFRIHNLTASTIYGVRLHGQQFILRKWIKCRMNSFLARCCDKFKSGG